MTIQTRVQASASPAKRKGGGSDVFLAHDLRKLKQPNFTFHQILTRIFT